MSKDDIASGSFSRVQVERYKPEGAETGRVTSPFSPFKELPKHEEAPDAIHLHWLWKKGPDAIRGVTSAVAICGAKSLPRKFVTQNPKEVTCSRCNRLV